MNLSEPLLKEVKVRSPNGEFFQRVECEGIPSICFTCGCMGHKDSACPTMPDNKQPSGVPPENTSVSLDLKQNAQTSSPPESSSRNKNDLFHHTQVEQDCNAYGPLMLVKHRKPNTRSNSNNQRGKGPLTPKARSPSVQVASAAPSSQVPPVIHTNNPPRPPAEYPLPPASSPTPVTANQFFVLDPQHSVDVSPMTTPQLGEPPDGQLSVEDCQLIFCASILVQHPALVLSKNQ